MKKRITKLAIIAMAMVVGGCGATMEGGKYSAPDYWSGGSNYISFPTVQEGNTYKEIGEFDFVETSQQQSANISLTVNSASYTDLRSQIKNGITPSKDAVRIEEMINYFDYDHSLPATNEVMSINAAVVDTPWNQDTKMVMVGMKTKEIEVSNVSNNLVLLIDISGSMAGNNRIGLVLNGFMMLVDELDENDTVSIVTYASGVKTVLDGAKGNEKTKINGVLGNLVASGATNGGEGIQAAYAVAEKYKEQHESSTIVLATDGDFNLGLTPSQLTDYVKTKHNNGVSLSAVGVGFGNNRSSYLEDLADAGGGRHVYISNITEARKFFVEELGGMLVIVANDAKAQIVFNPDCVEKFRLIGYENRILSDEEFEDEETIAGSLGSGLTVTAVFEIITTEQVGDIADIKLRYKLPGASLSTDRSFTIEQRFVNPTTDGADVIKHDDRVFILAVVEVGLLLRNSAFKGTSSYDHVIQCLETINLGNDPYKMDFLQVVKKLNKEDAYLE